MSIEMNSRFLMTAAALFRPEDRVRMRMGFYEGCEGVVIGSAMMVHIKLDHIPQPIEVGWNQIDNLTKPLTPFRYNKNR
jgi:hypothetical protein